jgi:membrane protein DedA with SNARE-associated domain
VRPRHPASTGRRTARSAGTVLDPAAPWSAASRGSGAAAALSTVPRGASWSDPAATGDNCHVEFLQAHLEFLLRHLLPTVATICFVDAAGVPFPNRIVLIIAGTLAADAHQLVGLGLVSTVGSLAGDHIPYLAGTVAGPRILTWYCRLTLGSAECVDKTVRYFRRFGATAVLLSRFSASVRLFASALSGCGHIAYWKFLAFDLLGTLLFVTLWLGVGHVIGAQATDLLARSRLARLMGLIGPLAFAALITYRLWRRRRYGRANVDVLRAESSCVAGGAPGVRD